MKEQAGLNACVACGTFCSPFSAFYSNKSAELNREAGKFSKCPSCGSINITKEKHTVEINEENSA